MNARYLAPIITAFHENGVTPDWEGNRQLYEFLVSRGISGVVLMGSTGEFYSMTLETQKAILDFAAENLLGRTEVIVGAARMSIDETIELCQYAVRAGYKKLMLVSPYYFQLTQSDLENYYTHIAKEIEAKIYLYNFPARTGHDLSPELVKRLAMGQENIVGIKDTVEDFGHTRAILEEVKKDRPDFEVFTGYDEYFAHCALSGGSGCIGGLANLFPEMCAKWLCAVNNENLPEISRLQMFFNRAMSLYNISKPFMPALKRALRLRGISIGEECAFPIQKLDHYQRAQLEGLMTELHQWELAAQMPIP